MSFQRSPDSEPALRSKSWAARNTEQLEVLNIGLTKLAGYDSYKDSSLGIFVRSLLSKSVHGEVGLIIPNEEHEVARAALWLVEHCPMSSDRNIQVCSVMLDAYPLDM